MGSALQLFDLPVILKLSLQDYHLSRETDALRKQMFSDPLLWVLSPFVMQNHIFSGSYQKLSFERDDNFGCRLMDADGCQRWEPALLLSGKITCPHFVVPARPHRTPVPCSRGARNSIRVVKYQILLLLLKGKCIH